MVPYIFAFSPVLLLVGDDVRAVAVISNTLTALIGVFGLQCALTNTLFHHHLNPVFRIVLAAGGLGMMIPGAASDIAGAVVIAAMCGLRLAIARKSARPSRCLRKARPSKPLGSAEDSEGRQ